MLSRAQRLTRGDDYRRVVRRGSRCAATFTVTHIAPAPGNGVRFGFIVGRNVGGAVARNTVRRRLKALCAQTDAAVADVDVVIRALPGAADAGYAQLQAEVERCLRRSAR